MSNRYFIFTFLTVTLCYACRGLYSFSGSTLPKEVKTFSVNFVSAHKSNAPFELPDQLTRLLKDKLSETDLIDASSTSDTSARGDIHFEGTIVQYKVEDMSTPKTVSVTVFLDYTSTLQRDASFKDKAYTANRTIENTQELEIKAKVQEIGEELAERILEETVNSW